MKQLWNSFQFQLYLMILLPILFLAVALIFNFQALSDASAHHALLNEIDNQTALALEENLQKALQITLAMIVLVIISLGSAFVVIRRISRSVANISKVAETLALADFSIRAETDTYNELAAVGQSFNEMAERFGGLINELGDQIIMAEEARAKAERSDQVKSAFLASMSHELRTPLNAVINFTKFVAQGDLGPVNDEQRETLFESVDSARHLLNLINDVLDMSKIESGSLTLFVQDNLSLEEILESSVSTAKTLLKDKPVEIREKVENLPKIRGDRQRIRQIFLNILSNACKFTEKGFIEIRTEQENGNIIFAFQDSGPGIAADDQDAVFQAFKQTKTGLRQAGGTGLGMPISRSLAEIHGGKLWLESEAGKGATFFVMLPIKSDALVPLQI